MVTILVTTAAVIVTACICISFFLIRQKRFVNSFQDKISVSDNNENHGSKATANLNKKTTEYESLIDEKEKIISQMDKEISQLKEKCVEECNKTTLKEAELSDVKLKLEEITNYANKQNDKITFISNIINEKPIELPAIKEFKRILETDYREFAKNNDSLADEAGALLNLQKVEQQLELFSYDQAIIKKTVIAIAGSFSSGKSSFMNSFLTTRKLKLPTGMTQTTAISSYILYDETPNIIGYSYKGGLINIPENIFTLFSHDKIHEFNFNMKQLVHSIIFKNKLVQNFSNLCFVDTPGFNAGVEQKSDYDSAVTAIATSSALIWCIDAKAGTIKDDEIDILYDIYKKNEKICFYIVVNKADLVSEEELDSVVDEIEYQLNNAEIPFDGISIYSSNHSFSQQPIEFEKFTRGISLKEFLINKDVENNEQEQLLLQQVKDVFNEYINADMMRIKKLQKRIKTINTLQLNFTEQIDKKDDLILQYKAKRDRRYKNQIDDTEESDDNFFDELIEIRADLQNTIKKDKQDIEDAIEISFKMRKCIAALFDHKIKPEFITNIDFGDKSAPSDYVEATKTVKKDKEKQYSATRYVYFASDSLAQIGKKCRWEFSQKKKNGSSVKKDDIIATIKVFYGRATVNYDYESPIKAKTDGKVYFFKEDSVKVEESSIVAVICDQDDKEKNVREWIKKNYEFNN